MKRKTKKEIIIWASGEFLTESLPEDYDSIDEDQLFIYIDDHASLEYENDRAKDIWRKITDLADSIEQFLNKE
ncbi:MAG: hypothetical protein WC119_00525 [Synergistaceae bacterium]